MRGWGLDRVGRPSTGDDRAFGVGEPRRVTSLREHHDRRAAADSGEGVRQVLTSQQDGEE